MACVHKFTSHREGSLLPVVDNDQKELLTRRDRGINCLNQGVGDQNNGWGDKMTDVCWCEVIKRGRVLYVSLISSLNLFFFGRMQNSRLGDYLYNWLFTFFVRRRRPTLDQKESWLVIGQLWASFWMMGVLDCDHLWAFLNESGAEKT